MRPTALSIENDSGIEANVDLLAEAVAVAMIDQRVHLDSELSIVLVDDDEMARLHTEWMDLPGPTDVMSFPMDEMTPTPAGVEPEPGMLGDIVLAPAFVRAQAAEAGHSLDRELALLTIHGLLHLLGYDHAEAEEERVMFALQSRLLGLVGAEAAASDAGGSGTSV